jgi:hypothetical protein
MMSQKRSTADVLILMIAGTICGVILLTVVGVNILELVNPDADTKVISAAIANVVNTLVGLLAGYLAGRTQMRQRGGDDQSN